MELVAKFGNNMNDRKHQKATSRAGKEASGPQRPQASAFNII
jgi:hypothetical protein